MIEYRYDGARARYLDRMLDEQQAQLGNVVEVLSTWTDYDGNNTYSDFTFSVTNNMLIDGDRYELGIAHVKVIPGISSDTFYAHNDHLGTLRAESDEMAAFNTYPVHTAFGENMTNLGQRHSYVGAFGYQSSANFTAIHVGARYYNPSSGRFLQRDPIGIRGGTNVYAYVGSRPTTGVDPNGLKETAGKIGSHVGGAVVGGGTGLLILEIIGAAAGGPAGILFVGGCMALGYDLGGNAYDDITNPPPPSPPSYPPGTPPPPNDCRHCHFNSNDRAQEMRSRQFGG